ncbi:MAG: lamin tail domain-containing protein [Planctomycetota bacterium]|nr:lamin tail domain-containing protein [Planctomycetota bacterium]
MIKTNALVAAGLLFTATAAFADVHINEVDADQTGTDSAEFIELYDGGVGNTDLTGLVVVLYNGNGDVSYLAFDLDGESTNGQGYFVLCGDAANVPNCDLDVDPNTNLIQNGPDAVALYTGDDSDFPNGTSVTTTNLLDAIVYDTNDDDDPGLLVLLNADQPQVNECGGGGCTTDSNQRCPNGSGGGRNTHTYVQAIPTPGAENSCAEVFGACCDDSTGVCTEDVAEASCIAAEKRYGGDGSDCSTIDPPCLAPPAGACCDDSTGECTDDVTQDDCDAAGNRYGGDESDCVTIDPPCVLPPTGACCSAGFCGDDVTQNGCETGGGTYQGDDSQCPQDCGPESTVIINEVRIDMPGTDLDEYFELAGGLNESLASLTYIVIGDGTGGSGVIEAVVDLDGNSLNASGLFLVAEDTFTLGPVPDLTLRAGDLDFENSDNVTHLLVAGFTGASGDDLDLDDDGVLDIEPWSSIVDCVALVETPGEGDQIYCATTVGPDGTFVPGHAYFCEAADQWLIGGFELGTADTPGAENPSCTIQCTGGGAAPAVGINEIRVKQAGLDNDEYFELSGTAFTSLQGVAYVVIGDSAEQGSGVVETVVCLNGQFILGDGFFVVAEDTFSLGDGVADLELPAGELNFLDTDNVRTHMIVLNFNGIVGADLDIDDDGVLDIDPPWEAIIADVALRGTAEPCIDGAPCGYSDLVVGPDGDFTPGHVYRCDPALTWTVGAFDTQPGQPECAQDTPGDPNENCDFVSPCGCSDAGSCFEANGTANCDDAVCCDLIISGFDATCADGWDQECANLALIECSSCGAANAGNCLVDNGTPYCTNSDCCNLVCGDGDLDPSCCELPNGWNAACAALANAECNIPPPVQPGDVVMGLSEGNELLTLELVRGPAVGNGGSVTPDSWLEPLIQSVEFDNLNGIPHNDQGNLLGLTFGSQASGGTIHSFAGCIATSADQFIGDTQGTGGKGLTTTRIGGLSVSPDNTKIAVSGSDSGQVIVYDYTAGNCQGTGASLSGARETAIVPLCQGDTQGTAWLDNDTVLAFSTTGELYGVDANSMAATLLTTVDVLVGCGPGYSDVEYNPDISPNIYLMYSAFSGGTTNLLFVVDPINEYNLLGTWDYSTSIETTREIAFDAFGNLFVGQYGGSETPFGPPIDLILDAANLGSLADNNSVDWYTSLTESNFSGMDVAIGGTAKCGTCPTDGPVNGPNGSVGAEDLAFILGNWGSFAENPLCTPDCPPALICIDDLDPPQTAGNQNIGPEDLAKVLGTWGDCPG